MDSQRVIRTYLAITGIFTLSASLIWGINTLFLLDAGLSIETALCFDEGVLGGQQDARVILRGLAFMTMRTSRAWAAISVAPPAPGAATAPSIVIDGNSASASSHCSSAPRRSSGRWRPLGMGWIGRGEGLACMVVATITNE